MNIEVRYFTRSGNTKKLADAVAKALGKVAESVDTPLDSKSDVLFLGCSYYAFDVDPSIKDFVIKNKDKISKVVCFGSSCMMKSTYKPMKKVCDAAGVELEKNDFHCKGSFGPFFKGIPGEKELAEVSEFAKKTVERLNLE